MKAFFFGSGSFPLPMFQKLFLTRFPQISLVTVPNRSHKEKNAIKDYAIKQKLEVFEPNLRDKNNDFLQNIKNPDIGIVCNYGFMIPSNIIDVFRKGLYVIHPSLLPKYRGAAPIQRALMGNEQETGVSFIEISKNKRFDQGAILMQKKISIIPTDTYKELSVRLSGLCADSIEEFVDNLDNWPKISQNNLVTTNAPKLDQSHQIINFNKTATDIYNQFRGVYGTNFHSIKFNYQEKQFFIDKISLINEEEQKLLEQYNGGAIGTVWLLKSKKYKNYLYFKFEQNTWLRVESIRIFDRGTPQAAYTFKDQYMKDYKFDSLENNYKID